MHSFPLVLVFALLGHGFAQAFPSLYMAFARLWLSSIHRLPPVSVLSIFFSGCAQASLGLGLAFAGMCIV